MSDRLDRIESDLQHITELMRQLILMAEDHERRLSRVETDYQLTQKFAARLASLEAWRRS